MNAETRHQAIAIAAIFAARDLANLKEPRELHSPRARQRHRRRHPCIC